MAESKYRKLTVTDLERMNVPRELWTVKIQGVQDCVRGKVADYLQKIESMLADGFGLLVEGDNGAGKTAIGVVALKVACSLGYSGFFSTTWELREMVRNREYFNENTTILGRCREVNLLVIDDLRSDDAKETCIGPKDLEALVMHRYMNRRATIITTRLSSASMAEINNFLDLQYAIDKCMVKVRVEGKDLREARKPKLESVHPV